MELSYRRAQLLELSRILAQCFENVNHYEDFARVDRSEALSAVRRRVQKCLALPRPASPHPA